MGEPRGGADLSSSTCSFPHISLICSSFPSHSVKRAYDGKSTEKLKVGLRKDKIRRRRRIQATKRGRKKEEVKEVPATDSSQLSSPLSSSPPPLLLSSHAAARLGPPPTHRWPRVALMSADRHSCLFIICLLVFD